MKALLLALLLSFVPLAGAQVSSAGDAPLEFADAAEERRFHALAEELRCVMCQNQSLADSNAMIARDLRHEVLGLMREGRSDREIREHLVARYGDFVLYRPRVAGRTWLLWFDPALVLLAGGVLVARIVRARAAKGAATVPDDEQEW